VVATLCLCALAFGAGQAQAHDVLVSTQPAAGSAVHTGPAEVRLVFDKPVQSGFTDIEVLGPGDTYWAAGPPTISGNTVSAPLRPLGPAGGYTIRYQIVSADGHPVSGQVEFTLAVAGNGRPAADPVGGRTPVASPVVPPSNRTMPDTALPAWLWLAGAAALAVALGMLLARRLSRN
jgi:methionine-rich copper-binding protein CopC